MDLEGPLKKLEAESSGSKSDPVNCSLDMFPYIKDPLIGKTQDSFLFLTPSVP